MSKRELRWFTVVSFLLGVAGIVLVILVNNLPIYLCTVPATLRSLEAWLVWLPDSCS